MSGMGLGLCLFRRELISGRKFLICLLFVLQACY